MKKKLGLRTNDKIVGKYEEKIKEVVCGRPPKDYYHGFCIFKEELISKGVPIAEYIEINRVVAMQHGWLLYESLAEEKHYKSYGTDLEKILMSMSNDQNRDRSINIKCSSATEGAKFLQVTIRLKGTYKKNFLIIDGEGNIVPSKFASMRSYNWDANSKEALSLRQEVTKFLLFY
jgi:hypothetical protein